MPPIGLGRPSGFGGRCATGGRMRVCLRVLRNHGDDMTRKG